MDYRMTKSFIRVHIYPTIPCSGLASRLEQRVNLFGFCARIRSSFPGQKRGFK